jgi:opacity protein-like surface antigen
MKATLITISLVALAVFTASAGPDVRSETHSREAESLFRAGEWDISLWGEYAFTEEAVTRDRYLHSDHGWGGAAELKYFINRFVGVGIEGNMLHSSRAGIEATQFGGTFAPVPSLISHSYRQPQLIRSALATVTLRLPLYGHFAPYVRGGAGAIGGGGREDVFHTIFFNGDESEAQTIRTRGTTQAVAEAGAGIEVRLSRHIGLMTDFSWSFVNRSKNDFGMVRTGLNFAF